MSKKKKKKTKPKQEIEEFGIVTTAIMKVQIGKIKNEKKTN